MLGRTGTAASKEGFRQLGLCVGSIAGQWEAKLVDATVTMITVMVMIQETSLFASTSLVLAAFSWDVLHMTQIALLCLSFLS